MKKRRLLPDIVSITPSNYDDFVQCERRFLNRHLLGLPPSDPGAANETGLLVHDLLRFIHDSGSCANTDHVGDVLAGHAADNDHVRQLLERHARRCPSSNVTSAAHEQTLTRFHKLPPPMFMAAARIDAVWVHDGILDARDYKTGRLRDERIADDPSAKVQVFVLDAAARKRGLRLHLRYEYLSADVADDPDAWEPEPEELAAIEEELRAAVERMSKNQDWRGVADEMCARCSYRSICRDSAARGVPSWPVLVTTDEADAR